MSKPSIFSKDYDKKMKARKRRKIGAIVILVAAIFVLVTRAYVLNWLKINAESMKNKQKQYVNNTNVGDKKADQNKDTQSDSNENKPKDENKPVENKSTINAKLPNGKTIKLECIDNGETKKIDAVTSDSMDKFDYDVNSDEDEAVVLDEKQNIYAVDIQGKVKDITQKQYISTRGSHILKDSYLASKPGFIWHSSPKFINKDTVVYISELPWFGTPGHPKYYVYKVSVNTSSAIRIRTIQGNSISFGKLTKTGLEIKVDNSQKYIDKNGNLVSK